MAATLILPALLLLQFSTPIQQGETETAQAGSTWRGGAVSRASASDLGVLRCPGAQSIVGARTSGGAALGGVQLVCAFVVCGGGQCNWGQGGYGPLVGQLGAGAATQACPADSVATGFRASTAAGGAYVSDLQIECGRASAAGQGGVVRVSGGRTLTAHNVANQAAGSCAATGATALTYAKGRLRGGANVVQAVSFYCADRVPFRPRSYGAIGETRPPSAKPTPKRKPEASAGP